MRGEIEKYCLGVFAKYWEPGRVKTRLAKSIGEAKAADVYLAFLKTLLFRFDSAANRSSVLAFSPDDRLEDFQRLSSETTGSDEAWNFTPQGDGDLGARLHRFFAEQLQRYEQVIVIGTDSPTLPSNLLDQANRLLESHDVVLGPSEDGGYYLVGARDGVPPIFSGIDWSTEQVWQQTVASLQHHRAKFAVLPTWYDVDTIDDLQRLQAELSRSKSASGLLSKLAASLQSP